MILCLLDLVKGNSKLYSKLCGKYRAEFDKLKDSIDDKQMEQEKTETKQENWVSWDKFKKLPTKKIKK